MGKNILIISNTFHPSTGGSSVYYKVLLSYLTKGNLNIYVLTTKYKKKIYSIFLGAKIYSLLPPMEYFRSNFFTELLNVFLCVILSIPISIYMVIKNKINIIESVFGWPILTASIVSSIFNKKLICDLRGISDFENREWLLKAIFYLKQPDLVVYNSKNAIDFLKRNGYKNRDIYISNFPFFLNTRKFKKEKYDYLNKKPHGYTRFLFVGRLKERKGIIDLLGAFLKLYKENKNIELIIVGSGTLRDSINDEMIKNNKLRKVIFVGEIPHDDMPYFYKSSDVFVLPSLSEGQPRSIIEALYFNLPVIATKVGDIPKMIENGHNGMLIDASNVEQLLVAMKELCDKSKRRKYVEHVTANNNKNEEYSKMEELIEWYYHI